jgi:plasmid maintenance system killer protein
VWHVAEHRRINGQFASLPPELQKRYEKWLDIAVSSGPSGLKAVRGFRDEGLSGKWRGHRSSRLNLQYRVRYRVHAGLHRIRVLEISPHDYRRRCRERVPCSKAPGPRFNR